jgi:carboxymethylenebutenolidase
MKQVRSIPLFAALLLLLQPLLGFAQAPAGREVTFEADGQPVHALLYEPAGHGKHPAIVVIHEWWGLNDWIKQQAADLASQGYVALAVDLYRGKVATDAETAHELMRGLPQDRGVADLLAATKYLASQPNVETKRIGAVGWCMGGGYAAQLAVSDPSLKAVAINYGSLPTDKAALDKIHAAVLGNFGALDRGITPEDVHAFENTMKSLGKPVNVKIYPDAGHAFENPNNQGGYKPEDAKDAQERMTAFFASELK